MKKLLYVIGGGILMAFALLCFFDFYFAWNSAGGMTAMRFANDNFSTDMRFWFPVKESFYYLGIPSRFSFGDMIGSLFAPEKNYNHNVQYAGILRFTREDWLQLVIFAILAVVLVIKAIMPNLVSGKAVGAAFTALTILAAWVLVKDFVEQCRYMFGKDVYGNKREMWQYYYFDGRETSKFRVFLCIALHAAQNLLLVAAFASMAAVCMIPGFKNLFFVPAFVAVLYAGFIFLCNLTGWGFALKWGFAASLIFLIVDGLLAVGLFVTGMAANND